MPTLHWSVFSSGWEKQLVLSWGLYRGEACGVAIARALLEEGGADVNARDEVGTLRLWCGIAVSWLSLLSNREDEPRFTMHRRKRQFTF